MVALIKFLETELQLTSCKPHGKAGGGCINQGFGLMTDKLGPIFVKVNSKDGARIMFDGEHASLTALRHAGCVKAPKPIKVLDRPDGGAMLLLEYLDFKPLSSFGQLGASLAKQHKLNEELLRKAPTETDSVDAGTSRDCDYAFEAVQQFGFSIPTCCGYVPQDNTWMDDWPAFYTRCRLKPQIDRISAEVQFRSIFSRIQFRKKNDKEIGELFDMLMPVIPRFFDGLEIYPALLHGDLWGGNVAETDDGPVVFDAASCFGHHEFELSISHMFGGFDSSFFREYHKIIPKASGYEERLDLYKLFHYLNHYNHFGGSYRNSCVKLLKTLVRCKGVM